MQEKAQPLSAIAFAAARVGVEAEESQPPRLKCPRCDSTNTKFCYYNNYNLSQPRHFCKNCRRYWTKGGALRNIPVGGGTRKNTSSSSTSTKRPNPNPSSSSSPTSSPTSSSSSKRISTHPADHPPLPPPALAPPPLPPPLDFHHQNAPPLYLDHDKMLDFTGSFSSLLHSNGQYDNILDASSSSSPLPLASSAGTLGDLGDLNRSNDDDNLLTWANGWPDLAIYTPGSTSFQ